jgi:hypothetical protein
MGDMEQVTIQEALDFCLENPEGLSQEELLASFPDYRAELASLLDLATGVKSLPVSAVPADRRAAMKAWLMAAAAAQPSQPREAATVSVPPDLPAVPVLAVPADQASPMDLRPEPRRLVPWYLRPGWIVAAAAILLIAFTWWSSGGSLPGSPFYSIKLASENVALSLAGSDEARAQENIKLANNRLYDLRTMEQRGSLAAAQPAVDNYSSHLDNSVAIWETLTGTSHTDIARVLYASSAAGEVTFDSFGAQMPTLPAALRQKISDTEAELGSVNVETAGTLTVANIDPASVFGSVDSNIAPLLIPVTSGSVALVTGTVTVPVGAVSPTVVATGPTTVPRPPAAAATATGVASQPGPKVTATAPATSTPAEILVNTPRPTSTFTTAPATSTPAVISTDTPQAQPTATTTPPEPVLTETPAAGIPTDTPVSLPDLPTDTPVPPIESTSTPTIVPVIPTDTPVPVASPTSTEVPPSNTPVPPSATPVPQANVCSLQISSRVSASCASANSVSWSATVTNPGPGVVRASYTAELLVKMRGGGGFVSVKSVSGTRNFSVGDTALAGTIGYNFPANVQQWKVRFSIDTSGYSCTVASHQSLTMAPCQ